MALEPLDPPARRRLAEALRALLTGQITNDEFEARVPKRSVDHVVSEVFWRAWGLYSDLWEYRLRGRYKVVPEAREQVARWVVFLETDLPYEWPRWPVLAVLVANLLTLGLAGVLARRWLARVGDLAVWPFLCRADYEQALAVPPYLNGAI